MKDTVHPVDEVINKMKEVEGFGGFVICNNDGVVLRHENLGAADKLGIHLCGNQPVSRVHPTILHQVISRRRRGRTWPRWLRRAARNRHRHAIEQASRRRRGGRRDDSAQTRRRILISTQFATRSMIFAQCSSFVFTQRVIWLMTSGPSAILP